MSLERTITLTAVWLLIAYEFVTYNILFVPGFLTTVNLLSHNVVPKALRYSVPDIFHVRGDVVHMLL
jgi:hypothetical protein